VSPHCPPLFVRPHRSHLLHFRRQSARHLFSSAQNHQHLRMYRVFTHYFSNITPQARIPHFSSTHLWYVTATSAPSVLRARTHCVSTINIATSSPHTRVFTLLVMRVFHTFSTHTFHDLGTPTSSARHLFRLAHTALSTTPVPRVRCGPRHHDKVWRADPPPVCVCVCVCGGVCVWSVRVCVCVDA
jgi:hypothetical protein